MQEFFPEFDEKMKEDILYVCEDVDHLPNSLNIRNSDQFIEAIFQEYDHQNVKNPEIVELIDKAKSSYQKYLDSTSVFISEKNEFQGIRRLILLDYELPRLNSFLFFMIRNDGLLQIGKLIPKKNSLKKPKDTNKIINIFLNKDNDWKIDFNNFPSFQNIKSAYNIEIDIDISSYNYDIHNIINAVSIFISKNKIKYITKTINDSLDKNIQDILQKSNKTDDIFFIKWITDSNIPPHIIHSRQQALKAYPAFYGNTLMKEDIAYAIDNKKPLSTALAKYYEVDRKSLKRIQGKTAIDLGIKDNPWRLEEILHLEEKNFQKIKNNLSDFNILRDYAKEIYDMRINEFLNYLSLQGHPCQHIKRMRENSLHDVTDAFSTLNNQLFLPIFLNKVKKHVEKNNLIFLKGNEWYKSKDLLIKNTNIKVIFDFSERYHRNLFRWEDMFFSDSGMNHISWQPMFDRIDLGNGWKARELHSVAALKEQGRRENHCVGGYAGSILKRDDDSARLIFSLEKDGEIKSTIDMLCSKNKNGDRLNVEIKQNRAHSNKDPDSETLNFSHLLLRKIKNNCFLNTYLDSTSFLAENLLIKTEPISKLNIYLDNLKDARKEYQKYKSENEYVEECGYNPWDRDILENVWDEFKPVLPRKTRHLGLDGLIDMVPLEQVTSRPREKDDPLNPWDVIKRQEQNQRDHIERNVEMIL